MVARPDSESHRSGFDGCRPAIGCTGTITGSTPSTRILDHSILPAHADRAGRAQHWRTEHGASANSATPSTRLHLRPTDQSADADDGRSANPVRRAEHGFTAASHGSQSARLHVDTRPDPEPD